MKRVMRLHYDRSHPTLSKDEIANAVAAWLIDEQHCDGVGKQVAVRTCRGIADVLGLKLPSGDVTIVEIKRSVNDFYLDEKIFQAMGGYPSAAHSCYIASERGLLHPEELMDPWGLIWVDPLFRMVEIVRPCKVLKHTDSDHISMTAVKALVRNLTRKRFEHQEGFPLSSADIEAWAPSKKPED